MKETFQSARSRQHRSSRTQAESIFFANRVDGAFVGQPNRGRQHRGRHSEPAGQAHRGRQGEPRHALQADRGSPEQIKAARASQGALGRQVEAAKSIEPACNGLASSVRLRKLACNGLASSVRLRKLACNGLASCVGFGKLPRDREARQAASSDFVIDLGNYSEVPLVLQPMQEDCCGLYS